MPLLWVEHCEDEWSQTKIHLNWILKLKIERKVSLVNKKVWNDGKSNNVNLQTILKQI